MFTDGDFHNPTLSRVIVFATEYESLTDYAKRRIINEAEITGKVQVSLSTIESIFGEGFVSSYARPVGQTYAGQNRGRKGSNRSRTAQTVRAKSLKERFAEEGLSHLLEDDEAYSSQETDLGSEGKKLTKEQQEYFKDSKARDENGNLKVVYHGTRKADFTVFKRNVTYFTDNKEMADSYSPNGDMYEGYLDIKKPYEIDAQGEKWSRIPIDDATKKFLQEYGAGVFKEGGKWRTSPADIVSAIEEAVENGDMDYDGIIIKNIDDTGSYYKDKDNHVATDYIVFNSNQFKNVDNKTPTSNPDIRYSSQETDADVYNTNGFKDYDIVSAVYTIRNEKAKRGHDLVEVGNMPTLYRKLFGLSGKVYVSNAHLYQNMVSRATAEKEGRFDPDASADYHELGEEKVINAIEQFQDPLVIMESLKDFSEPRLVAILEEKGNDGENLIAVMELYAPIAYPGKNQRRNHVLITIYEKNSLPDYIDKTAYKDRILYKKEGLRQTRQADLQLVGAVSEETLKKNVARYNKKVKDFKEKNKINYSTQETDYSNRDLLANAFEGLSKSSVEYKMIQDYKEQIKVLNLLDERCVS